MATRFAVATGNWSSGGTWDNGSVPVAGDVIYTNGKVITIDQDINVDTLRNSTSNIYLPSTSIPAMLNNTTPSGTCISSNNPSNAYRAFDATAGSEWQSTVMVAWIGYTFASPKIIKRYYIFVGFSRPLPQNQHTVP